MKYQEQHGALRAYFMRWGADQMSLRRGNDSRSASKHRLNDRDCTRESMQFFASNLCQAA